MAGVGLPLDRLDPRPTFSRALVGYSRAAVITCGPWISTALALGLVVFIHRGTINGDKIALFAIIIIYNFIFSLVFASPVVMAVSRDLADRIYAGRIEGVPGLLLGSLAVILAIQLLVAVPYYGFVVELPLAMRLLAIAGFFIIGGIWICGAFLAARRSFAAINLAFATGNLLSVLAATAPWVVDPTGMLAGFTLGLGAIFLMMLSRTIAEYPGDVVAPGGVLGALSRHRDFALAGLLSTLGIWIDKWIMWAAPNDEILAGAMPIHPAYDASVFFAFLSIIPAMAVFFLCIETRFFAVYRRFYLDIDGHATLAEIRRDHEAILDVLKETARRIVIVQTIISYALILLAPQIVAAGGGGQEMVPIFRFALLGALFHVMVIFIMMVLSYFDLGRHLVRVAACFLVLNGGLTGGTLMLGTSFFGYGYLAASILTLAYACHIAMPALMRLPYMTFIANNRGLH